MKMSKRGVGSMELQDADLTKLFEKATRAGTVIVTIKIEAVNSRRGYPLGAQQETAATYSL
jgi:hypothetical protein